MDYLSLKQTAEKWGISVRRVQTLCSTERIAGAVKIGSYWAIPVDAEKPKDERVKSGKYVKPNSLLISKVVNSLTTIPNDVGELG